MSICIAELRREFAKLRKEEAEGLLFLSSSRPFVALHDPLRYTLSSVATQMLTLFNLHSLALSQSEENPVSSVANWLILYCPRGDSLCFCLCYLGINLFK